MDRRINWARVGHAVEFYRRLGFRHVWSPWTASEEAVRCTYEGEIASFYGKYLVGSAEQGLLDLALRGELPEGLLVTAGPCFRLGDHRPPLHQSYFFKVELWGPQGESETLIGAAESFFRQFGPTTRRKTPEGTDLDIHGVEVGSYGERQALGVSWSYGTGLAEPRLEMTLCRE